MPIRVSYPHEAILAEKKHPLHFFSREEGLVYLGTHFEYDVYIQTKNNSDKGYMYCVYGSDDGQYYSGVGYGLVRTNRPPEYVSCYDFAASCALLNNPQYIEMVLAAHRD